jgi:hypothetical protein
MLLTFVGSQILLEQLIRRYESTNTDELPAEPRAYLRYSWVTIKYYL